MDSSKEVKHMVKEFILGVTEKFTTVNGIKD
jgi:hypothetical protein